LNEGRAYRRTARRWEKLCRRRENPAIKAPSTESLPSPSAREGGRPVCGRPTRQLRSNRATRGRGRRRGVAAFGRVCGDRGRADVCVEVQGGEARCEVPCAHAVALGRAVEAGGLEFGAGGAE